MDETNVNVMNERNEVSDNTVTDTTQDYISAIKEMRANSVSKDDYNALKEQNKQLLGALINGDSIELAQNEVPVDIDAIRKDMFKENSQLSNLQYVQDALILRNELIKRGEPDPFLPWGKNISPTTEDIATAERVAEALQACVDYADGDSEVFTNELQRITIDSMPMAKTMRRK